MNKNYNPLITYFFVNKSLKMSSGKIGVQTARAGQVMLLEEIEKDDTLLLSSLSELFKEETMRGNKTICLKASQSQMKRILSGDLNDELSELSKEKNVPIRLYPVTDIGATEVPENSLTVIAMTPVKQSIIKEFTKKFQLY
jgi:Uncharacterized conserved protein